MPTESQWIELTRALDPKAELPLNEEGDRLYVEIEYSPSARISRKLTSYRRLARDGAQVEPPPKFLYCGARGSGKSTQLRHLARSLGRENEVILVDLATVLPESVTTVQLVTHIGLALLARLGQWEGADGGVARVLDTTAGKGFGKVVSSWVEDVDLPAAIEALSPLVSAAEIATDSVLPQVTGVFRAIRAVIPRREAVEPVARLARAEKLLRRLEEDGLEEARTLSRQVSALAEALHGRAGKPVVLLVDGLDKVPDSSGVLSAFDERELITGIQAAVVFAAPATLSSDVAYAGLRQDFVQADLHNVPVVGPDGAERGAGLYTLEQIAERRLGATLRQLLTDDALHDAALASSGIPRDFLMLLTDAALVAEDAGAERVEREHVARVAKEFRLRLQRPLTQKDVELLARVLKTRRPDGSERAQTLLFENFIAWYPNDHGYYRPHELLAEWVRAESERTAALGDEA